MLYKDYNVPRGTIEEYIKLLLTWSKKINLVSARDEQELIDRHILDSLQLVNYIDKDQVVFDIGSGAGFPGLMLSYAGIKKVNLIEKNVKKADFLNVAASLSKNEVKIYNQAVEMIDIDICDVITARGLASIKNIFVLTKNLAKENTKYVLLKGKNVEEEIKNASVKWSFEYIIHKSKTSEEGCVLEVENLKAR